MSAKKRLFKNTKKKVGNKSVNPREKTPQKVLLPQKSAREVQEQPISPNIPQIIADNPNFFIKSFQSWKKKSMSFWIVMFGIIAVAAISVIGCVALGREIFHATQVAANRAALQQEMKLWEDISSKYPTYRDANFQVAILAYRLGDKEKEREFIEKTLAIDPNFEPAKRLGE